MRLSCFPNTIAGSVINFANDSSGVDTEVGSGAINVLSLVSLYSILSSLSFPFYLRVRSMFILSSLSILSLYSLPPLYLRVRSMFTLSLIFLSLALFLLSSLSLYFLSSLFLLSLCLFLINGKKAFGIQRYRKSP